MSTFDLNSRLYAMYCFQSFNLASKRSEQRKKAIFNFYVENSKRRGGMTSRGSDVTWGGGIHLIT